MSNKRVVITGMGVVAPNGVGLEAFEAAIRAGNSGVSFQPRLEELKFGCQIGAVPQVSEVLKQHYFSDLEIHRLKAEGIIFGMIAAREAWDHAGLSIAEHEKPDWDTGAIFGAGLCGMDMIRDASLLVDAGRVKRLGSSMVEQTMPSGISAHLSGYLGLGNQVSTNASACSTGTEAIIMGYERIKAGKAKRMVCGGCEGSGPYVWSGFDSMRVLTRKFNDNPEAGSRPMSASSSGFVPGSGAGALILEEYETAIARSATIYGEVLGGYTNSGGHRGGGTMTAPNGQGVQRCILGALEDAHVKPDEIDAICGHLTSTIGDPKEITNWSEALNRAGADFPYVNSLKSMIGHCLSGTGAIESVAALLQLNGSYLHASLNCEDLHPEIAERIDRNRIPQERIDNLDLQIIAKSSFGFGDVNCCVLFKKH